MKIATIQTELRAVCSFVFFSPYGIAWLLLVFNIFHINEITLRPSPRHMAKLSFVTRVGQYAQDKFVFYQKC